MATQSILAFEEPTTVPTEPDQLQHFLCGVAWTITGLHHLTEKYPADAGVIDKFADHADDFSETLMRTQLPGVAEDLSTSATRYLLPELLRKVTNANARHSIAGDGVGDEGNSFFKALPYRPQTGDELSAFLEGIEYSVEQLNRERQSLEDPEILDEFLEDARNKIDRLQDTYS